ncbi:phosphotransferase [Streptomyces sp. DT24]|uniref:phosphotransferase n=1 Tax=unclassified Streptomyces TaxID=2593676 RepID=UPI0023B90771|nr:phosphotransferase [Streptomyces sp. AM 4-1-1]WEH34183.1 phosphotransferase [Streptomyces sp. AM 4-1-1]
MRIGQLLGSGRTADVYALDDEAWVLRRYRDGADATPEAAVMAHLADHGFPVPRVTSSPAFDSRSDLVMRRLTGTTMLQALLGGALTADEAATEIAGLLDLLHTVPARLAAHPGDRVLHLDLHPDNVVLTPEGPVVIDWTTSAEGPPGRDRAMSALILAQVAVDPASPAASGGRALLTALMPRLAAIGGVPDDDLAHVAAHRAANPMMSAAEVAHVGPAAELVARLAARCGSGAATG